MTRFQIVAKRRDTFEVKRMCQLRGVRRSGSYAWVAGAAARQRADEALAGRAGRVRATSASHGTYGAPRVPADAADTAGARVSG